MSNVPYRGGVHLHCCAELTHCVNQKAGTEQAILDSAFTAQAVVCLTVSLHWNCQAMMFFLVNKYNSVLDNILSVKQH